MISGLTGNFSEDEKLLMSYTIQEINHKKYVKKIQLIILFFIIGIFLTLAIFTLSVIQKDNDLREDYGDYYHCYMCGYINGKTCLCNMIPDSALNANNDYFVQLGEINALTCEKTLE
ncbi:MAG: hypothetical protein EOL97_07085 [Spirochaetia bacterium]|nr:hypothetical protein [Spirochaetia bacterium]